MRIELGILIRPYVLVPVTVLLSFLAWSFPEVPGIRKGFVQQEHLTWQAFVTLAVWYMTIIINAFVGFKLGQQLASKKPLANEFVEDGSYNMFSLLAGVGTLAVYAISYRNGSLSQYLHNPFGTSANVVRLALYDNYSIGILSLRYLSVVAFSFAVFRFLRGLRLTAVDLANFGCLFAAAFMSGRILVTWAVCVIVGLMTSGFRTLTRPRSSKSALSFCVSILMVLWVLNYSRNLLYYRALGNDSFVASGFSEVIAYLGTPMQVSIGVASGWETSKSQGVAVDHEQNLTTNSALDEMLPDMGYMAFLLIAAQSLFFAMIGGWASRQKSIYLYAAYPVTSYVFAELWRMNLFFRGIFACMLGGTLAVSLILALMGSTGKKRSKLLGQSAIRDDREHDPKGLLEARLCAKLR